MGSAAAFFWLMIMNCAFFGLRNLLEVRSRMVGKWGHREWERGCREEFRFAGADVALLDISMPD